MDAETTGPGRWRRAWDALMGRDPAPEHICIQVVREIQAEWRDFELELSSYMEKMNAWAARQAKREKRAAERALNDEPAEERVPTSRAEVKAALRRSVALGTMQRRGMLPAAPNGGDDP